jgi:hypothetical protein
MSGTGAADLYASFVAYCATPDARVVTARRLQAISPPAQPPISLQPSQQVAGGVRHGSSLGFCLFDCSAPSPWERGNDTLVVAQHLLRPDAQASSLTTERAVPRTQLAVGHRHAEALVRAWIPFRLTFAQN